MIDEQTARKLAAMGVPSLAEALGSQDSATFAGVPFNERVRIAVDQAFQADVAAKVRGLERRAHLRYPQADMRTLDLVEERGIDRAKIAELSTCAFVGTATNVVVQGFTGSGKSWLLCAIEREACRRQLRSYYVRMPDLEEKVRDAGNRPGGRSKLVRRLAKYRVLAIDEWLLDKPDGDTLAFLLELTELRYGESPTLFGTQYKREDWHERLGGGVHADAIMDRIVHNAVFLDSGEYNMRERMPLRPMGGMG